MFLVLITKGFDRIRELIVDSEDDKHLFVFLYFISGYAYDHYSNTTKLKKSSAYQFLDSIKESGRVLDLGKGLEQTKLKLGNHIFLISLHEYCLDKLIVKTNCSRFFAENGNPFVLSELGTTYVKSDLGDMLDFVTGVV
jgi:hypothetical protein